MRVPEHAAFPYSAVRRALLAEVADPAGLRFEGTSHQSTVVRVPELEVPVVVRRRRDRIGAIQPRYLSEHAVLRAIERSGVPVRAPAVLALGVSGLHEQFAIHTYLGPRAGRPPSHPEGGLRPHEADDLVDQLCGLTKVDTKSLAPMADGLQFHTWLCDRLVDFVDNLPDQAKQLAGNLGLPDGTRLGLILARHRLTPREPVLLHGDLNPWNLVRDERDGRLGIIDWERAMVGDPLYDLVRHFHLTPTRPEIRDRMLRRWQQRLPDQYTAGWREDRHVYRWIEGIRSAYVDLARLVSRDRVETPDVRRALDSYASTLDVATATLGVRAKAAPNPLLVHALPGGAGGGGRAAGDRVPGARGGGGAREPAAAAAGRGRA
ncbi:aminoglycoside phosphotransferase family protein [Streptomyces spinoverrucosus]|uniref:aminoglycoside phosphotransferase family protein n=1 Tax=Streptomyces spinoverrucosus TaxID=284043 RepID=UPI0018C43550|nr:aminoglycoside phosphotransferase family protein [Streptomyces spinoverrucosus]